MSVSELINEILSEWAYRIDDGMPNPKNPTHINELGIILSEMGLSSIKNELLENLEEEEKQFKNSILNKEIPYKSNDGSEKKGLVGNLLRLPKEHPGRKAAENLLPPEGSDERNALNKDLGSEKDGKSGAEAPVAGDKKADGDQPAQGGDDASAKDAEKEKQKQTQAMFTADPAMTSRLDIEKDTLAKIADTNKEADKANDANVITHPSGGEKQKPTEETEEFKPIPAADVNTEMPQADPDTFGGGTDIPDGVQPEELEKFNTDIKQVQRIVAKAKENNQPIPDINLCDITVPGTNLYCDDNLGIPRDQMPQFKGKAVPGSRAASMPTDKNGEVDTEPIFKKMLEEKGIKVLQTEVPADKLKATQKDLVGGKVVGMMGALEEDPKNPNITAPIYVSRDGFVIDGHHRWAAIVAYNAQHPDAQIPMKTTVLDMDIKDAIPMCNKFAEDMGVAVKKADANKEGGNTPKEIKGESKTFKGNLSGKEIKSIDYGDGAQVFGVEHGNKKMVDDIINNVKSSIPKDKWKDIVFLGEGGASGENGEMEFQDEVAHAANQFKKIGAGIDSWDGDDMDVHNDQSKLYQKQKEKTGLSDTEIKAGNWASMIGQGEGTDTMSPDDYLDDKGKQFLQNSAKEAGLPQIENWDNPTDEDKDTLYRLSFPEDNGDKETKVNDIQVAFNKVRDENLLEKTKELKAKGKIPISIAGEGHVDLVNNMMKNENSQYINEISVRFAKLIKEVVDEMVSESMLLMEAKPKQDNPDVKYMDVKGKAHTIKFSSAIAYPEEHPAYIAAMKLKDKKGNSSDTPDVKRAGLYDDPEYQKRIGAEPSQKTTGKKKKEKEFPKGYIAPTVTPSQVKDGLDNGDLTALTECNDNLLHNRDIGVSGMGGPVASYGEAGVCRTVNTLRERGYEGFVDDNIEAVNAKMQQIKEKKPRFQKAINTIAIQKGYELPKDEEKVIEYLGARLAFSEQEFQRLSSNPDSIWTKEGKQGFGSDRDAFDAWAKAIFDGALSTKSLIENESDIDTTKQYVVIQSNTIEGEGHDEGILNHLKDKLEKAKQSGNQEDIQHYSGEIDAFTELGFHDTMVVGFDKKGRTCVFSITNKKQDDLADIWGNTTPAYMLNIIKKQFDPKVAIKVVKVIDAGIADVSDAKMATNREFANFKIDSNFLKVLETPELKKYTNALKDDPKFNKWLKEKMGKKYPPTKLLGWMTYAQNYVQSQLDAGENPSYEKFGKLLTKVGELGQNPKYIRKYKDSIKFNSAGIQAAVENKNSEKELTAKVHKNVVRAIESADKALKTWPGKEKGINGPHKQAYVTTVIHSMHLDLMITNYDKKLGAITGIRGTTPADFRDCMSELSGFKSNPKKSEAENRAALNKHLVERCTLDPVSHAILIKNSKGTVTLAEDTWRTAGTSQKVEKKLGDGLRGCVASKADARQKSNRQAGK